MLDFSIKECFVVTFVGEIEMNEMCLPVVVAVFLFQ